MNLKVLGNNQTELSNDKYEVLFSYNTPVAYRRIGSDIICKSSKFYSNTTCKHISNWCNVKQIPTIILVDQKEINSLI